MATIIQYTVLNYYLDKNMGENGLSDPNFFTAFMKTWGLMLVSFEHDYTSFAGKAIWFINTIWLIIVMLNLLISIISNTHDEVQQNKKATDYKV